MQNWIVLVPPVIVLTLAIATHNVLHSLLVGIIISCLIATHYSPLASIQLLAEKVIDQTGIYNIITWSGDFDKLYVYGFLLLLGIIITLITYAGGTIAYSKKISGKIYNKKAAESLSVVLASCFFLDDYFNALTTGSIVRPIFDHFKIARAKLAFYIDVISSSTAALIPLSSWTAMISSQLAESGISEISTKETLIVGDPFIVYLQAIPYTLYPIVSIAIVWAIVQFNISYGPMKKHDEEASKNGNLYGGKNPPSGKIQDPEHTNGTVIDFLLPMGLLIGLIAFGLLYTGRYWLLGGENNLADAVRESKSFITFFFSALITLIASSIYFLVMKKISRTTLAHVYHDGIKLMAGSVALILLASIFGSLLKHDLQTGQYLAEILIGSVPSVLLPCIFFISSSAVAAATGSSWGTFLVMYPIAIPMIASLSGIAPLPAADAMLLLPTIGAILSGSIAGAHISPISDATLISSTASGCHHIDHVKTQIAYVLPIIVSSAVGYILSGIYAGKSDIVAIGVPLLAAFAISFFVLFIAIKRNGRPNATT